LKLFTKGRRKKRAQSAIFRVQPDLDHDSVSFLSLF